MTTDAPLVADKAATGAARVAERVRGGAVSKDSAAGVLREAARESLGEPTGSGEVLEETLRLILEMDVVPEGVASVLQSILDSGLVDDFAEHVLDPAERALCSGLHACCTRSRTKP